jgi:serine protease inhibitor
MKKGTAFWICTIGFIVVIFLLLFLSTGNIMNLQDVQAKVLFGNFRQQNLGNLEDISPIEFNTTFIEVTGSKLYPHFAPDNVFSPLSLGFGMYLLTANHQDSNLQQQLNTTFGGLMMLDNMRLIYNNYAAGVNANARIVNQMIINGKNQLSLDYHNTYGNFMSIITDNYTDKSIVNNHIRSYFSKNTDKSITNIIRLKGESSIVYLDSFYFTARWNQIFSDKESKYITFYQASGKTRSIRALHKIFTQLKYFEDKNTMTKLLEIPFYPQRYVFGIFLPSRTKTFNMKYDVELSPLYSMISQLQKVENMEVTIPKLRQHKSIKLSTTLKRIGMKSLFENSGDKKGLENLGKGFYLTEFVQEILLSIEEYGANIPVSQEKQLLQLQQQQQQITRLRSIQQSTVKNNTSMVIGNQFIADHPFVYYIRDQLTNAILLVGDFDV